MDTERHLTTSELERHLDHILASPGDNGVLELIVRRPETETRETLTEAALDLEVGLVGDNWKARGSRATDDGSAHPGMQLNIMNSRIAEAVAQSKERMPLAGDQLYLDMDLSRDNLPPGTQLALGDAIIEVTEPPHTGCKKFAQRFGKDAMVFVNSGDGRKRCFRGICAKVVKAGTIRVGDTANKIS